MEIEKTITAWLNSLCEISYRRLSTRQQPKSQPVILGRRKAGLVWLCVNWNVLNHKKIKCCEENLSPAGGWPSNLHQIVIYGCWVSEWVCLCWLHPYHTIPRLPHNHTRYTYYTLHRIASAFPFSCLIILFVCLYPPSLSYSYFVAVG